MKGDYALDDTTRAIMHLTTPLAADESKRPLAGVHDETIYGVLNGTRGQSWLDKCNALEAALVKAGWTPPAPLREWGYTDPMVLGELRDRDIVIPYRTDCAVCYHQRIGEWYLLWVRHPDFFDEGIELEDEFDATFRTPGRDSWPSSLRELKAAFVAGRVPKASLERMDRERMNSGACRVCSL